ncbi:MAG: DNA mismatch repair endonuclease MutL [Candidatus Babeliales bacterium]
MAQTIKILDPHEAIKIAAGEVIERPAHIIKELIENSIDAQASAITIHTRAAGKDEISIADNGSGMSPDDATLCFAHHATSKISTVHDLQTIVTYGFRGEALSSIASVSRVELITKTAEEKSATHLVLHEGKVITETVAAREVGTTLTITDLFASIPARKKFLKSDDTEWNLIVSIFQAFCLRYPNIHFKLFHNGHLSYNCPPTGDDLKSRCAQLWSSNLHEQLINLEIKEESFNNLDPQPAGHSFIYPSIHSAEAEHSGRTAIEKTHAKTGSASRTTSVEKNISVVGAISTPHYYRFNRGQIFTFVNNRWVKNIEITKGIIKGYDGVLPTQKYPAAFLFITIDPTQVDINVHPKKEEVKFLHPGIVQRVIQEAVAQTLSNSVNVNLATASKAFAGVAEAQPQVAYGSYKFFTGNINELPGSPTVCAIAKGDGCIESGKTSGKNDFSSSEDVSPKQDLMLDPQSAGHSFIYPSILSAEAEHSSRRLQLWRTRSGRAAIEKTHAKTGVESTTIEPVTFASSISATQTIPATAPTTSDVNECIYEQEPYSIVGQFKKTYIMLEKSNQLILIDQHAAHERILFEQFKKNMAETATVRLLFPHIVKLSSSEVEQITAYEKLFYKHGIQFEAFSQTELIIQATPVQMQAKAVEEIIHLALAWIKENHHIDHDELFAKLHEKILAEKACKAACKAGDTLNHEQMDNVIKELLKTENRFCCPHGRPTVWGMELKDIEKHFKRDYVGSKQSSDYLI